MAADSIQKNIRIPLLHIAEMTAKDVAKQKLTTVGLLGTKFTMELPFFKEKLSKYDIQTIIPNDSDKEFIHASIYAELGKGIFSVATKRRYLQIIEDLKDERCARSYFRLHRNPDAAQPK